MGKHHAIIHERPAGKLMTGKVAHPPGAGRTTIAPVKAGSSGGKSSSGKGCK